METGWWWRRSLETVMIEKIFYYATTAFEALVAVFGITGPFEQPSYRVLVTLAPDLEIRDYGPTLAVEATAAGPDGKDQAFRLLFNYITGGNKTEHLIAMTAPVRVSPSGPNATTVRFYLPASEAANPVPPADPRVRLVRIRDSTVATYRFYGNPTQADQQQAEATLMSILGTTAWRPASQPFFLGYNPPFTIPFLKRNEIAIEVSANSR
jgi:hypothetical protein